MCGCAGWKEPGGDGKTPRITAKDTLFVQRNIKTDFGICLPYGMGGRQDGDCRRNCRQKKNRKKGEKR